MLLDSNIIIYAAEPGYDKVREFIAKQDTAVSVISKTANTKDFSWIDDLEIINPIAQR